MSGVKDFDPNAWMVTFADLVMLLLTFFVLLLTMSSMDKKKLDNLFTHFKEATGVLEFGGEKEISDLRDLVKKYHDLSSLLIIDQNDFLKTIELAVDLENSVKKEIRKKIYVEDDERGIVLSFHQDILFDPGMATLREDVFPILDALADAIDGSINNILIMGHTDGMPVKNKFVKSNWELSSYRGLSVLEYFIKKKKLSPLRFSVGGYGPSRPLYSGDSPENRAKNRRVEIIFQHI